MIHQNRCQSWKSLSVYLLTSQWVSQSITKQTGAQWLQFSGFFTALVTHIPVCALRWQVGPWTAGKWKLFHHFGFFCLHFLPMLQHTKENRCFQLLQILKKNSCCTFSIVYHCSSSLYHCIVITPARTCSGRKWFGTVCVFASGEHRTETDAQTGR